MYLFCRLSDTVTKVTSIVIKKHFDGQTNLGGYMSGYTTDGWMNQKTDRVTDWLHAWLTAGCWKTDIKRWTDGLTELAEWWTDRCLINEVTSRWIDQKTDRQMDRQSDCLTDEQIQELSDKLMDWPSDWLNDWQTLRWSDRFVRSTDNYELDLNILTSCPHLRSLFLLYS